MKYQDVKEINLRFFAGLFEKFQDDHHVVGQSELSHRKRFEKILELADFSGRSVLDIGCGIGGFYGFLREKGIRAEYSGFDINEKMIAFAKERYPEIRERFSVCDIMETDPGARYDYVIAIGPLNLKFGATMNLASTRLLLERMFGLADIGMAVSMTSWLARKRNADTYYYHAGKIIDAIARYCSNFKLDHAYLPHDFTVFCYKKDLYDDKTK